MQALQQMNLNGGTVLLCRQPQRSRPQIHATVHMKIIVQQHVFLFHDRAQMLHQSFKLGFLVLQDQPLVLQTKELITIPREICTDGQLENEIVLLSTSVLGRTKSLL